MAESIDTPYIHPPPEKDDDPNKNGLYCFMDENRECGADCMAYAPAGPVDQLGHQTTDCLILVSLHRLTARAGVIAKVIHDSAKDSKRAAVPPPPDPRGGR